MFIDQAPRSWTGLQIPECLSDELGKHWHLRNQTPEASHWTLCDNADWSLWRAGGLLLRSGRDFEWREAGRDLALSTGRKKLRFWWDFPEGPLRQRLRPLLGVRALLEQARVRRNKRAMALCNKDQKTVARLVLQEFELQPFEAEQQRRSSPGRSCQIQLLPMRGYDQELEQIAGQLDCLLRAESWKPHTDTELIERHLLCQAGLQPPKPQAKTFGISADEQTEPVVRRLAVTFLQRARAQQWGLVADLDTEFLHQYRVALRKTRSLLALMKALFPEDRRQQWKARLSELARATNQVRDLDVFLLSESNYRQLLPGDFDAGLNQLFKQGRRQRRQAFQNLRRFVQSQTHAQLFDELIDSFSQPAEFATELAARPVKPVVDEQIVARYRKICRCIARLDSESPAEQLHQVRIAGKKLRYLMEFFAELYPAKPMAKNIKATKNLQSLLGDFNDYSVQIALLRERLDRAESPALAAAVNGLIAVLYRQQSALRADLADALQAFCSDSKRRKLEQMCRDTEGGL